MVPIRFIPFFVFLFLVIVTKKTERNQLSFSGKVGTFYVKHTKRTSDFFHFWSLGPKNEKWNETDFGDQKRIKAAFVHISRLLMQPKTQKSIWVASHAFVIFHFIKLTQILDPVIHSYNFYHTGGT